MFLFVLFHSPSPTTDDSVSQSTFIRKDNDSQSPAHALQCDDDNNNGEADDDSDDGSSGSDAVSSLSSASDSNHSATKPGMCYCWMYKLQNKLNMLQSFTLCLSIYL